MLSANVAIGDEAEAQTVPYILGIAHPTGFPAYTLAGWLFSHAMPVGTVAWRLNAFTAVCTALTATGVYLLAVEIAVDIGVAALTALSFAFGMTVWHAALHANAQSLAAACSIFALLGALQFARSANVRALAFACGCCGLGIATHPSSIWIIPAIVVALAWQAKHFSTRTLAVGAATFAAPLLLYAYLPLRSAFVAAHGLDPNAGAPLFGAGGFDWDANSPRTVAGFLNEVLARHEGAGAAIQHVFAPRSVTDEFRWWFDFATMQYSLWLLLLAVAGTAVLALRDLRALTVIAAGTIGGVAFAYIYRHDMHIDRYGIVTFAVFAVLAAATSRIVQLRLPAIAARSMVAIVLALVGGFAFVQNRTALVTGPTGGGQTVIDAARQETPDRAIIVAEWNDAAALGYGAFVEHALGSRLIVTGWPAQFSNRYEAWSLTRPVLLEHSFGPNGASFSEAIPIRRRR
jgi:hypothetical protein